jgi:ABC-type bacteriocin/lantibiotic exporter with double-glycine peptidase domain
LRENYIIFKRAINLLEARDKNKILKYIPAIIAFGIMDLIGVALLGTIGTLGFKIMSNDPNPSRLEIIIKRIGFSDLDTITLTLVIATFALIFLILKTILNALFNFYLTKFMIQCESKIADQLLLEIVKSPLLKINSLNISDYQFLLMTSTNHLVKNIILGGINMLSDIFLIFLLGLFAFYSAPITTIVIFCVIYLGSILIYKKIDTKAKSFGNLLVKTESRTIDLINEILKGIKEVKVYDKELVSLEKFSAVKLEQIGTNNKLNWLNSLVKYYLEISILFMGAVAAATLIATTDMRRSLTILVIYLAIGLRILPSIQRIQNAGLSFRASKKSVNNLFTILDKYKLPMRNENTVYLYKGIDSVIVKDVRLNYAEDRFNIEINPLSFEIKKGEIFGISGESGIGKTTLVDLILGLNSPQSGTIHYGFEGRRYSSLSTRIKAGYVSQNCFLFGNSLIENIAFYDPITPEIEAECLPLVSKLGLQHLYYSNDPKDITIIKSDGSNISGGEKQRIALARAIYSDADVVVLDEPTSALDEDNMSNFFEILNELKTSKIIIIISHDVRVLDICDKIITLKRH